MWCRNHRKRAEQYSDTWGLVKREFPPRHVTTRFAPPSPITVVNAITCAVFNPRALFPVARSSTPAESNVTHSCKRRTAPAVRPCDSLFFRRAVIFDPIQNIYGTRNNPDFPISPRQATAWSLPTMRDRLPAARCGTAECLPRTRKSCAGKAREER